MDISIKKNATDYTRSIESMGKGLVLFKVCVKQRILRQNFHYYYEDKRKPPLDLAINPKTRLVEYISFFAQDEVLINKEITNEIIYIQNSIVFSCNEFTENNPEKTEGKEFQLNYHDNNIYSIDKNYCGKLIALDIDKMNCIIFDEEYNFMGCILKKITDNEYLEIVKSDCS